MKHKKTYITLGILLFTAALVGVRQYKKSNQPPEYEITKVERGNIKQTVNATGKIESVNDVELKFEIPGTITNVFIKEGDKVKANTVLANLRLSELNATVAQAYANLNQKLAGTTEENKRYYAAAVDAARASLEQAKVDADNGIQVADSALETAKNNLKLAEGGEDSLIVSQAYEDMVATLQSTMPKLDDAVTQADNILGQDNSAANESFRQYLAVLDSSKLSKANTSYAVAKEENRKLHSLMNGLTALSGHSAIDAGAVQAEKSLLASGDLLNSVADVLVATPVNSPALTAPALDTKKTTIATTRTGITSQYSTVLAKKQALANAKNSLNSYTINFNKATQDLETAKANKKTAIAIREAALNQALANYQSQVNPPREVDVASYRAILAQAVANRDKAILRAPIDGVVTKVNKKVGEAVSMSDVGIEMLSPHYEVQVDIPETDVPKLKINDDVEITLDAFGEDTKLNGTILAIDPGSTEVQDVVYYKVTIGLDDSDKPIKPGMTANVTIKTAEKIDVLFVPLRTVRTRDDGSKYLRILENKNVTEVPVKLGLKADDGKVEVADGLKEGQEIVVSVKEKK